MRYFLSILWLLAGSVALAQNAVPDRLPIPAEAAVKEAATLVADVYKADYDKAKTQSQKIALAKKLIQEGDATKDNPAGRFVLYRIARDIAAQQGDLALAWDAIEHLAKHYGVEPLPMQIEAAATAAKGITTPKANQAAVTLLLPLLDSLIGSDQYPQAKELAAIALGCAKEGRDADQIKRLAARTKEIEDFAAEFAQTKAAWVILEKNPVDPAANFIVGKFHCLSKGEWDDGIPKLALGPDGPLQKYAELELAETPDPIKLGDECWKLAQTLEIPREKESTLLHAAQWYEQALPTLSGLERARVAKRLDDISALKTKSVAWVSSSFRKTEPLHKPSPAVVNKSPGKKVMTNSLGMKLIWCPPGKFTMGSPEDEQGRNPTENQVEVELSQGFWLGQFEVTQAEYFKVKGNMPWKGQENVMEGAGVAASCVTYLEAMEFCARLTESERRAMKIGEKEAYSLPTEAQWEYACRAGTQTAYSFGNDDAKIAEFAWFSKTANEAGAKFAHRVGLKKSNPLGFYDMHGNVLEWCRDAYGEKLAGGTNPENHEGPDRVSRGGSWFHDNLACRSACRGHNQPSFRAFDFGFRVVLISTAQVPSSSQVSAEPTSNQEIKERNDNDLQLKLIWCPPGKFMMGSPQGERGREIDEEQVEVTLTQGFWLGKYEVTQAEYQQVMGKTPWKGHNYVVEQANRPATDITYEDALEFCRSLTVSERKSKRLDNNHIYTLPTEAQWEYACRAGTSTAYSFGPSDSLLRDHAWCEINSQDRNDRHPRPVGQKKPNPFGLHDMHGNVWEWCRDGWATRYPGGIDPLVQDNGIRIERGGSWIDHADSLRCAKRIKYTPVHLFGNDGFRVALVSSNEPVLPFPIARKTVEPTGQAPGAGRVRSDNGLELKLLWCPPGKFMMGSPRHEIGRNSNENQVPVELSRGFWLGRNEVTQEEFQKVMGVEPWKGRKDMREHAITPASFINHQEATEFCQKFTASERQAGRLKAESFYTLPTEAQWEYACRAGLSCPHSFGDDATHIIDFAWCLDDVRGRGQNFAHPVALKRPNLFGFCDMHGNVSEWCRDGDGQPLPGGVDPEVIHDSLRVLRGGSWSDTAITARTSYRNVQPRLGKFDNAGFRIALITSRDDEFPPAK